MISVNKVILQGNVGKDPEVKHLDGGQVVANFSLATNKVWKNKQGEKQQKTEWHKCVAWGPLAEKVIEPYVTKGTNLYVEGELETRSWEDNDGTKKYMTEIRILQMQLGSSGDKKESSAPTANAHTGAENGDSGDTGLPF